MNDKYIFKKLINCINFTYFVEKYTFSSDQFK